MAAPSSAACSFSRAASTAHRALRSADTDQGAYYQYCDGHDEGSCFLLKCEKCGAIRHLDCSHLGELYRHLEQEHHFRIDPRRTLFYGLCEHCGQEESV